MLTGLVRTCHFDYLRHNYFTIIGILSGLSFPQQWKNSKGLALLRKTSWKTLHLRFWQFDVTRFGHNFYSVNCKKRNMLQIFCPGGHCRSNRLSYRFVAGVWCLAAFIFVQAYTSILFTYIVTPINQPLIKSVYDIVEHNDIQFLVRKGSTLNQFISVSSLYDYFLTLIPLIKKLSGGKRIPTRLESY
jgi:hypothetical protein